MSNQSEWDLLSEREKEQFSYYHGVKNDLVHLHRYTRRYLAPNEIDRVLDYIVGIEKNLDKWAGQKWTAAVDEVMETRIDMKPVRFTAA